MSKATESKRDGPSISPLAALQSLLRDYFFAIFGAAVVALLLRVYIVEAFRIPTDFMAPVLVPGDHIFVNKLAYGGVFGISTRSPGRGEIVIFSFPNDPAKDYIKRVIAVGKDTVEIRAGQVLVNGKPISKGMDPDTFEEALDGHQYYAQWKGIGDNARHMMPVTVPEGQLFVLGDNRAKGQDSRVWGFLPVSYMKGRASLIWFSTGSGVRWERIFKSID